MAKNRRGFAFALGQRVNVPGPSHKGVQGVISLPRSMYLFPAKEAKRPPMPVGEHIYFLVWVGDDGSGQCGWSAESELLAAQMPPSIEERLTKALRAAAPIAKRRARRKSTR